MIILSVIYPKSDHSHFDHAYYMEKHIPLVQSLWGGMGLVKAELMRGESGMGGAPFAFELIGLLTFLSAEHLQSALAASGDAVMADLPKFTNIEAILQINTPLTA